ncbi:HAD-IA family hydrolase [Pontixanthobacter aquaemixtae]|uniref:phosphoglycolate phosphatase n=1 Tax=Pontixanthobacter aquaemixtae TaxID=1958940 RepID=A0A844ZSQ7_9SPHN|nr:HAD-IA family hydrolase [Pontixanthobacter aquaemixtae]MXO90758.1 HAD-IA family hydrolase [Pontixanthobacter aquaemixtae]
MSDFPFSAVGFDLDGTLLDTHQDLGAAVNHALELGGFKAVPVGSSKDLIGGGAKIMLSRAVEAQGGMERDAFHALYKKMLAYYAENNAVHSRPYPGIIDTLDALEERGVKMAVVTNKFESFATSILTQLGLADRFVTIIGGDTMGKDADGKQRAKPAPDPIFEAQKRCGGGPMVFVGDSSYDINAARAADVPVVACAYGYCDKPADALGADAVVQSASELVAAFESLSRH